MEGESSWDGLGWWGDEFTYYEFLRHVMIDTHWYEHMRLIRGILHESPDISYDDQAARQTYLDKLNCASECGPYKFRFTVFDNGTLYYYYYWPDDDEWSSINRLIWPERLGIYGAINGFYNGLDYMLMHNLFCLTYQNFIEEVESGNLNPLIVSTDIISTNTIPSNIVVIYRADRKIQLKPGFNAENNSFFNAYINMQSDNFSYRKINYQPQCNYDVPHPPQTPSEIVPILGLTSTKSDSLINDSINISQKPPSQDLSIKEIIQIYPNPAHTKILINSNNVKKKINSIEMVNTLGQQIVLKSGIEESNLFIDVSQQSAGIYFVKILVGKEIFIKQVIIEK